MSYDRFADVVICPNGAMSEAEWIDCSSTQIDKHGLPLEVMRFERSFWQSMLHQGHLSLRARFNGFALVYLLANLKDVRFAFLDDQDGKPLRDKVVSFWQTSSEPHFPTEDYGETYDYLEKLFLERGESPDIGFDGRNGDHVGWVRVIKIYEEFMTEGCDDLPPTHYRFCIHFPRDGNEGVVAKLRILGAVNTLSTGRQ